MLEKLFLTCEESVYTVKKKVGTYATLKEPFILKRDTPNIASKNGTITYYRYYLSKVWGLLESLVTLYNKVKFVNLACISYF